MIKFNFKGHKIAIRNEDWKKLKERFNPDNVEWDIEEQKYFINVPCSLCKRYRVFLVCPNCPLTNIGDKACLNVLASIFRKKYFNSSNIDYICWERQHNPEVRRQLRSLLRRMERIEAQQK